MVTTLRNTIKMHANVICKRHLKIESKTLQHGMLMIRRYTHTRLFVEYLHSYTLHNICGKNGVDLPINRIGLARRRKI